MRITIAVTTIIIGLTSSWKATADTSEARAGKLDVQRLAENHKRDGDDKWNRSGVCATVRRDAVWSQQRVAVDGDMMNLKFSEATAITFCPMAQIELIVVGRPCDQVAPWKIAFTDGQARVSPEQYFEAYSQNYGKSGCGVAFFFDREKQAWKLESFNSEVSNAEVIIEIH